MLQWYLEGPSNIVEVPIEQINYTHDFAMDVFRNGAHTGLHVHDVTDLLVGGQLRPTHESMQLDCVYYHGQYWSLNNRHLKALNLYVAQVQPDWLRREQKASVKLWAPSPGLQLHGRDLVAKFCEALSTDSRGRSLSLRPSSRSQSRRRVSFGESEKV
jgi:hypothetical protein